MAVPRSRRSIAVSWWGRLTSHIRIFFPYTRRQEERPASPWEASCFPHTGVGEETLESDRLKRIFEVLEFLTVHGPQTLTQVSSALSLPVSSTHDLLKAMSKAGMAESTQGGYDIGPASVKLSFKVQERFDITNVAAPELEKLVERIGFDVYLAIRTRNQIMYAARFRGRQGLNIDIPLGLPLYRHATAVGKLFAAFDREIRQEVLSSPLKSLTPLTCTTVEALTRDLEWIRSNNLSVSREEAVTGIVGVATPIRNPAGRIVGAAHISALKNSLGNGRLEEVSKELQAASAAIELRLAGKLPKQESVNVPSGASYVGAPIFEESLPY